MLTLIIPTMDRPDFLIRLLNYYYRLEFKFPIIIGDSSQASTVAKIKEAVNEYKGRLNIVYRHYPGLSEPQSTYQMIQEVSTPYVAWLPDDDFIVPSGLITCLDFIKNNFDYSVALGYSVMINLNNSGPYGLVNAVSLYQLRSSEAATAKERLLNHFRGLGSANSNFGVHRLETFKKAYFYVNKVKDKAFTEIIPNGISIIHGKIKQLNCLYLVRQTHDRRYLLPHIYNWLTSPSWYDSYCVFEEALIQELSLTEKMTLAEAKEIIQQVFWCYLAVVLKSKYDNRYRPFYPWRRLINQFFSRDRLSLSSLLRINSRFYKDFKAIYDIVSGVSRSRRLEKYEFAINS